MYVLAHQQRLSAHSKLRKGWLFHRHHVHAMQYVYHMYCSDVRGNKYIGASVGARKPNRSNHTKKKKRPPGASRPHVADAQANTNRKSANGSGWGASDVPPDPPMSHSIHMISNQAIS